SVDRFVAWGPLVKETSRPARSFNKMRCHPGAHQGRPGLAQCLKWLFLHRVIEMPTGQHSQDSRGRRPGAQATPPARHILVVDDDAAMREMISDYLGNQNFRVSTVADGEGMLRVLQDAAVDLVILDMKLAGEDGLD